jgi:hypothetical protein
VADNPLRMLFGGRSEGSSLKDLERNAKSLRLQAKHGPICPTEPLQNLCPRQRSAEDYALAAKQVSNPTHLAVALFFWPSSFGGENPMQNANRWLLEAEGLPQGDGHKAQLLVQAISEYDSMTADSWVAHAIATARQMLESEPDLQQVRSEVGEAVKKVAELAIADFGDTIETSEIDLLNAIDACVRLPEIRGAARAGESVMRKQLERIDAYLDQAYQMLKTKEAWRNTGLKEVEIQELVTGYQKARCAFGLLQRRPALLRSMPADRIGHLSVVSVALAHHLGTEFGRWEEALRLTSGIDPKDIDPKLDRDTQLFYQVACRALPLLRRASQGHDVGTALDRLRQEFPDGNEVIEGFKRRAEAMRGKPNTPVALANRPSQTGAPAPVTTGKANSSVHPTVRESGQAPQNSNGIGCLVVLMVFLGIVILANSSKDSSVPQATPAAQSYRVPRSVESELTQAKTALEQERQRVAALFRRLDQLQREIDSSTSFLDRTSSLAVAEHNRKVSEYNSLAAQARSAQSSLNARVDAYNTRLRQVAR